MMVINWSKDKSLQLTTLNAVYKNLSSFHNGSLVFSGSKDSSFIKTKNISKDFYYGINTKSKYKRDSLNGIFTLGTNANKLFNNAIIITRPQLTPTIAGKTNITGDLLTAKRKINKGRLFGLPPLNDNYLNGEIIFDENINPKLFKETLIKNIFDFATDTENIEELDEAIEIINELTINKLKNKSLQIPNDISIEGFLEKGNELETLELYVTGITHFTNETKSTYNLRIYSDSTISIGENVHLENAVLISQTNIDVGSNCSF